MSLPHDKDDGDGAAPKPGSWGEYRRLVLNRLEAIQKDQEYIKEHYVSQKHFDAMLRPIFRIVYTAVGIILASFLGAIAGLIYSGVGS